MITTLSVINIGNLFTVNRFSQSSNPNYNEVTSSTDLACLKLIFAFEYILLTFVVSFRTLIPILHQKAKRGTPHQAKQAVHCIHAIFNNKEVQLAQIFEVSYFNYLFIYVNLYIIFSPYGF